MKNNILINTKLGEFHLNVNIKLVNGINCFFGPSGAGKTSIINCIAGIIKPKKAKIVLKNNVLIDTKENKFTPIHKRNIGYVFQEARLFPHLSVKQNLLYGYRLKQNNKKNFIYEEIISLLKLENIVKRYPYNLSGGEKQRVAIGRALLSQPKLILMDEPLSSLDQERKDELIPYIIKINKILRIPAIYVSHSVSETFILGNKINFIKNGKIIFSGERDKALAFYNNTNINYLKDNYLKGTVTKIFYDQGVTLINMNQAKINVFSRNLKLNQVVIVKIKSSDIIISMIAPKQLSSLNFIKTKLSEIIFEEQLVCLILAFENNSLKAHITIKSFNKLKIKKKMSCYAIIKAININSVFDINLI